MIGNLGMQGDQGTHIVQEGLQRSFTTTNAPLSNYYSSGGQQIN